MTAEVKYIDFYLIKQAAISGAFLLINYFLWSASAPSITKLIAVVLMIINVAFFLGKKPFLDYWPIKVFIISLILISLGSPTPAWDARSIWLFHAKRIFFENNLYAQLDGYTGWSHNDYPVLIPSLSATLGKLIGHWNEVFPKFSSVLALCPAIFLLTAIFRCAIQQILLCIFLMFVCSRLLVNGYMDGILAVYFTAASLLIYVLIEQAYEVDSNSKQRLWLLFLSVVIFSILTLIKNEGLVALAVLLSAAILSRLVIKGTRITLSTFVCFLVSIIPIIIWKIICAKNGIVNDLAQSHLISQLVVRIYSPYNYSQILNHIVLENKLFYPLILSIIALFDTENRNKYLFVNYCALLYLGIIFMVYLSTPYDLTWHLETSADRTVLTIELFLVYYFIVTYGKIRI